MNTLLIRVRKRLDKPGNLRSRSINLENCKSATSQSSTVRSRVHSVQRDIRTRTSQGESGNPPGDRFRQIAWERMTSACSGARSGGHPTHYNLTSALSPLLLSPRPPTPQSQRAHLKTRRPWHRTRPHDNSAIRRGTPFRLTASPAPSATQTSSQSS